MIDMHQGDHFYCISHFKDKLNEAKANENLNGNGIKCECNLTCTQDVVRNFIEKNPFFSGFQIEWETLPKKYNRENCWNPGCNGSIISTDIEQDEKPSCTKGDCSMKTFCPKCYEKDHEGTTCEQNLI